MAGVGFAAGSIASLAAASASAAEPVTRELLVEYADWLLLERRRLLAELFPDPADRQTARHFMLGHNTAADRFHIPFDGEGGSPEASTRAALVLSTVGCDWRR